MNAPRRTTLRIAPWSLLLPLAVAVPAATAAPPRAPEVTPKHWSYQAVQELAARGLVHGYKDAEFLDDRKLTRFEMASLVKRVLDNVARFPLPREGERLVPETPGLAASRGQGVQPPPLGRKALPEEVRRLDLRESDLPTVKRLTEEYSVELAVIGADLHDAGARLQALEGRLGEIRKTLDDPEGPLQKAVRDVARIDRLRFGGYVQARYDAYQKTRETNPADSRGPVTNRFVLRRMRLTLRGRPTQKVGLKWELEGGGDSVENRDAFASYFLTGNPATGHAINVGQMKVPFGFEIPQSSGAREVPERARVIRYYFPSERDRGLTLAAPTGGRWYYEVGVFNGIIGPGTPGVNTSDDNNDKSVGGRVRTTQLRNTLDVGASFFVGNQLRRGLFLGEPGHPGGSPTDEEPHETKRITLGADLQWHPRKGTELRAEYLWGKAFGTYGAGYILEAIQSLGARNQLVIRYDWLGIEDMVLAPVGNGGTPVGDAVPYHGTLSNLALGLVHHLDPSMRVKLFYEINGRGRERLEYGLVPWQGNVLRFEVLTLF